MTIVGLRRFVSDAPGPRTTFCQKKESSDVGSVLRQFLARKSDFFDGPHSLTLGDKLVRCQVPERAVWPARIVLLSQVGNGSRSRRSSQPVSTLNTICSTATSITTRERTSPAGADVGRVVEHNAPTSDRICSTSVAR